MVSWQQNDGEHMASNPFQDFFPSDLRYSDSSSFQWDHLLWRTLTAADASVAASAWVWVWKNKRPSIQWQMQHGSPWPLEQHLLNILPQLPQTLISQGCRKMQNDGYQCYQCFWRNISHQTSPKLRLWIHPPAGCKRMPNPPGCCHPPGDEKRRTASPSPRRMNLLESAGRNMSVLRHVALEMLLQTKISCKPNCWKNRRW